jgi:hypothetical protein
MNINEWANQKERAISRDSVSHYMADETTITAPSTKTAQKVPIGAEVTPGESSGKLRVFDSGVDDFPSTGSLGFAAVYLDSSNTRSLASLLGAESGAFPQNFKAKRSITILADSSNSVPVYVGDINTSANATGHQAVGFPLNAGASITLEITNPAKIYFDVASTGQTIYWIAV